MAMKICWIVFLCCFICCTASPVLVQDKVSDNVTLSDETVKLAIEFIQMFLSSSYSIPDQNITYTKSDTRIQVNISNCEFGDVSNFSIDKSHVIMSPGSIGFQLHLTVPSVNITGYYDLNATTDVAIAFGNGPFRLNTSGIELEIDMQLNELENKTLNLQHVYFDYNISYTNARLEGLLNDTDLCNWANDAINYFIHDSIHDFKPDVDSLLPNLAMQHLGYLFNNVTMTQLVNFIKGFGWTFPTASLLPNKS